MTVSSPLHLLGALVDSAAWPALRVVLHAAFIVAAILILWRTVSPMRYVTPRQAAKGNMRPWLSLPTLLLAAAFLCVLVYQGSWQVTGLFRPQFVAIMQSHDHREFNPARGKGVRESEPFSE